MCLLACTMNVNPLVKTALRRYQNRAVEIGKRQSLVVVLPTGSGKTLIAAAIAATHVANGKRVLFLVPTCLLVQQQARAVRTETDLKVLKVAEYMGGASLPEVFQVLVSTPAAFIALNTSNEKFRYETFGCIIFDEVHHVMKKHPYRKIARSLACIHPAPHILGLTASLTYAMGPERIQTAILELCAELNISGTCIFSATEADLLIDGYMATISSSVTLTSALDLCAGLHNGLEIPGQPHAVMSDFMHAYKAKKLHPLSMEIFDSIYTLERKIVNQFDGNFVSPIGATGKQGKASEWSGYANTQKRKFLGANQRLYEVLEHLYEALRLLINSRQTALELALYYLEMADVLSHPVLSNLFRHWTLSKDLFLRVAHLKEVLMQQHERFPEGLRCIVFVQQRISAHILHYALSEDSDFSSMLTADFIYATASPATCTLSVSPSKSRETIQRFRDGFVQVLVSTSVAEEGMDVPSANCVIRFDAITTPVSLVQSRGRARQADSAFVILSEAAGRSVQSLEKAELAQHEAIAAVNSGSGMDSADILKKREQAQVSRRLNARPLLTAFSKGQNKQPPLAILNMYAQKVSGEVIEATAVLKGAGFLTSLRFMQFGAAELQVRGEGTTKKIAIQNAAKMLLDELCRVFL